MRRHMIYAYWFLLLAPTLIIGALAYWALAREQERQEQNQRRAAEQLAEDRADLFAKSIRYRLQRVQRDTMASLTDIPDSQLVDTLATWDREEPLIRNVFVWNPNKGLALPDPNHPGTREQLSFIMRYELLFSGRMSWQSTLGESAADDPQAPGPIKDKELNQPLPNGRSPVRQQKQELQPTKQIEQQQLFNLPNDVGDAAINQSAMIPKAKNRPPAPYQSGWTAWFAGNQLHLLGWAQMNEGGPVRGIELEQVALLSRLYQSARPPIPQSVPDRPGRYSCMLLDGNGQVIYQDSPEPRAGTAVAANIPLGPALPHWQVQCVYQPETAWTANSRSFLLYGSLLVGIFLAAIVAGGSLLLIQARRSARDAARKTSFVSNVSHELKTPLTSIRMYAELLNAGRVADSEKRRKYEGIIVSETERLSRLVNNVLDFSRLEQGRKKYKLEALPVDSVVNSILDSQEVRIQDAGMELVRDSQHTDATILADRDAVEQILINLIDNACKYAADGKELAVETLVDANHVDLCVKDRGPGIDRSECERIFEKFQRLDDSLSRTREGVGLGLSITRRLARDMNGELSCHPRSGGGTVFCLRLVRRKDDA